MILRPYQSALYDAVREAFGGHDGSDGRPAVPPCDRVFMSLPCGGGKTAIFSAMAASAHAKSAPSGSACRVTNCWNRQARR